MIVTDLLIWIKMSNQINVLELFAGSRSIGKVSEELGYNVYSSDINDFPDIDYVCDILDFHPKNVPFIPDIIWASPPCTCFSICSNIKHFDNRYNPITSQSILAVQMVRATIKIIKYFLFKNPNLVYYIENPRGRLRKLSVMDGLHRATIWMCRYNDFRAKPTDIWSNNIYNIFNVHGWIPRPRCFNNNKNCHHDPAPRGTHTGGTQACNKSYNKDAYNRAIIPYELCKEILNTSIKYL